VALRLGQREAAKVLRLHNLLILEGSLTLPRLARERLRAALIVAAAHSLPPDTTS
jgi:hypothetical protein